MKVRELIRQLQEHDPTGESEVCVHNIDILGVHAEPAYWDGCLQVLKRDPALAPHYDVVGGKYVRKGSKIVITPLSITDVLWDDPDAEIDYSEFSSDAAQRYRVADDETRKASRNVELKVEMDSFYRWVKDEADKIRPQNSDECRATSDYFYERNLSPKDPVKDLPPKADKQGNMWHPSWDERRRAWWSDALEVYWKGGWGIRKKDQSG